MARRKWIGVVGAGLVGATLPACLGVPLVPRERRPPSDSSAAAPVVESPYHPVRNDATIPIAWSSGPGEGLRTANVPLGPNGPAPAEQMIEPSVSPGVDPARPATLGVPIDAAPPLSAIAEPALLAALRTYLDKHPDRAVELLKAYDQPNQDLLLSLLPLIVRLTEDSLNRAEPQELAVLVEQLQSALAVIRPRAALLIDHMCFCRRIQRYRVYEALPADPEFRPGELVEVYVEPRNFSCPRLPGESGAFAIRLASILEVRDSAGQSVWRKEFEKSDLSRGPWHDYFCNYCVAIPNLRPGSYTLWLQVTDRPTGRAAHRAVGFRVIDPEAEP